MRRAPAILLPLLTLLLAGCSTTNEVVGKGPFQKRKYRPGWHVDLGRTTRTDHHARHAEEAVRIAAPPPHAPAPGVFPEPEAALHTAPPIKAPSTLRIPRQHTASASDPRQDPSKGLVIEWQGPLRETLSRFSTPNDQATTTDPENGPRRWNRMALVSGVFLLLSLLVVVLGGGGVLLYLLFFAFLTGVIGLLLAIKHNERGKGIAIAAIVVPALLIALIIVALREMWG